MHWDELAEGLGGAVGLPALRLNEQDAARVCFPSGLVLDLAGTGGRDFLVATASLGDDPRLESAYRLMLDANLSREATGGGLLGLDPDTGEALLIRQFPLAAADLMSLATGLNEFVAFGEEWLQELRQLDRADDDES